MPGIYCVNPKEGIVYPFRVFYRGSLLRRNRVVQVVVIHFLTMLYIVVYKIVKARYNTLNKTAER